MFGTIFAAIFEGLTSLFMQRIIELISGLFGGQAA